MSVRERAGLHNERRRAAHFYCRDCSIQFGHFSNASGLQLQSCGTDRLLRGLVAVLAVRPRRVPEIMNYSVRLDQLPRHIHQFAAQFRKNVAEPGGIAPGRDRLSINPMAMGSPTWRNTMGMVEV